MPGRPALPPLTALLHRLARRYRWVEGAQRFAARAWLGPAVGLGVLVIARWRPVAADRAWALGLGLALLALLAALAWGRRVSLLEAARRCDRDLGLADRLATACAMAGELAAAEAAGTGASTAARSSDPAAPPPRLLLLRRQRDDAWRRVQDLDPRAAIRLRLNPGPVLAFVALSALSLLLALFPNPQHGALAGRQRIRQAAARVAAEARRQEAALRETTAPAGRAPADAAEALGRLAERLDGSQGRAEADLAALAEAEQELRRAQDPGALRRGAEAEALAERLGKLAEQAARSADGAAAASAAAKGAAARATAAAAGRGAAAQASSQDLARLADAAGSLAAGERQALAAGLRAAAAGSLADGGDSARAMEGLAQALDRGDAAAAGRAADALGQAMDAAQREGAAAAAVQQALDSLATGRRDLAQANAGTTSGEPGGQASEGAQAGAASQEGATQGQAGSASPPGAAGSQAGMASQEGAVSQDGAASQAGAASQEDAAGSRVGSSSQEGPASQEGAASQAGAGSQAAAGAGRGAVASDLVYAPPQRLGVTGEQSFVPGQAGEDGSGFRQGQAREPGQGASGRVPFAQVLPIYRAAAARALDRAQVPAARRDYVRSYFAQLGE